MLAEKKGSGQLFAIKTIVKKKNIKNVDVPKQAFYREESVGFSIRLSFSDSAPFRLPNCGNCLIQTTKAASTLHWRNLKTALLFLKFPFTLR